MSVVHSNGKETVSINENDFITIETKSEEGYEWKEITYKSGEEFEIYIGSYHTYNYSSSREWMEYNNNFIALLAVYTYGYDISDIFVNTLFNIETREFIESSQEERLKIYNCEFKERDKKRVLTQK